MMAHLRARKAGFAQEAQRKVNSNFDAAEARTCFKWIETLVGDKMPEIPEDKEEARNVFYEALCDGMLLCRLVAALGAEVDFKRNTFQPSNMQSFMIARKRERIGIFLDKLVSEFAVPDVNSFQTDDLYERTNLPQVCVAIRSLGIQVQLRDDYSGPHIWPKKAPQNVRQFSQEQINATHQIIPLQYGTNKGANQSGIIFGKSRSIND